MILPEQFRPAAPPAITSAKSATAYLETKSLGKTAFALTVLLGAASLVLRRRRERG